MKKRSKTKNKLTKQQAPKTKVISELAQQFDIELKNKLPIAVQPNGSIVYKNFLIKEIKSGNWAIFNINTKDILDQFYLKTCALMAAKAYSQTNLQKYFEIKEVDTRYCSNHNDTVIFTKNIKAAKDFDKYLVLLNRLEHSQFLTEYYRDKISTMFKWSFV